MRISGRMELLSATLSMTDVIVIAHPADVGVGSNADISGMCNHNHLTPPPHRMECTPFNIFCGKGSLVGVQICVLVNGKACMNMKMQLKANGLAKFENDSYYPEPGVLEKLPLRRGKNHLEARILHSLYAYNSHYAAEAAIWWWPQESKVCVVDIDGTVTISDKRGLIASSFVGAARALGSALGHRAGGRRGSAPAGDDSESKTGGSSSLGEVLSQGYVHAGVGSCLTHMAAHGARLLYVTARPITLAHRTRDFLKSLGRQVRRLLALPVQKCKY